MEKRDIVVIIIAIIIVFIMAMYIKPIVTGKEAKLIPDDISGLIGGQKNGTVSSNNTSYDSTLNKSISFNDTPENTSLINATGVNNSSLFKEMVPVVTPLIPWNGTPIEVPTQKPVRYSVVPREYPVSSDQRYSFSTSLAPMKTYTTIDGNYSQVTGPIYIPSQYWEIWYSVDLLEDLQNPELEEVSEDDIIVQSASVLNPVFKIIITDYDTKQKVAEITPTGGLDPKIWKGLFGNNTDVSTVVSKSGDEISINWDPRPWKEKFFEGYRNYQLDIIASHITSYKIEIKLPDPDAGNVSKNETLVAKPGEIFRNKTAEFFSLYDKNFTEYPYRTDLTNLLSSQLIEKTSSDEIIRQLYLMKLSGINISDFVVDNTFYRLDEGNINGIIIWNRNGKEYNQSTSIDFINEDQDWKINSLPIIRL